MPCYHPLGAYQRSAGAPLFFSKTGIPPGAARVEVACGQCIGCRLEYSRQWAVRMVHESKLYENNSFLTLTYDDEHVPLDLSLRPKHFTDFIKRLRERCKASDSRGARKLIRYFMCGEYGETFSRPHYHAALFNYFPEDAVYWCTTKVGHKLFTSAFLDSVWSHGRVFVGELTFESAGYIARYVLKKCNTSGMMRDIFNVETGEIYQRTNEYCRMSLRPGIGRGFVDKYACDIFPHDRIVIRGVESPVPRYYNKILEKKDKFLYDFNRLARVRRGAAKVDRMERDILESGGDIYNVRRLDVEEVVKMAAISHLKRS